MTEMEPIIEEEMPLLASMLREWPKAGRGKSRVLDLIDAQMIERLRLQGREVRVIDPKMFVGQVATARELGGQA